MKPKTYAVTLVVLTIMGSIFAGYLSATKLLTSKCAFGESCPIFLGQPACYYGFAMFFLMLLASTWALTNLGKVRSMKKVNLIVSLIGILFAGNFVIQEITNWMQNGNPGYTLILPTCSYGLIFYIIIFILSLRKLQEGEMVNI